MMRLKPETLLIATMSVFAVTGVAAVVVTEWTEGHHVDPFVNVAVDPAPGMSPVVELTTAPRPGTERPATPSEAAGAWFSSVRGYCNPVDVETRLRWFPAPGTDDGAMHEAACLALAGRIDRARGVIEALPAEKRYQAAGVVFAAGHPAADAGDELAAGPLMELVVEFWPNHHMALYHAGSAAYERGDHVAAERYLGAFLEEYGPQDGWRRNALAMLESFPGA